MKDLREICFLWRAAGFGATPEELDRSLRQGYEATVEHLLSFAAEPQAPSDLPLHTTLPPGVALTLLQVGGLVTWWLTRMVESRRPLEEKLTLFWHGHFTTSVDPVFFPGLLVRQNLLLREHAGGRFLDLLKAVTRDPAMLLYLDGARSTPEHPNENYARELLELFTVGIGHYTEEDVRSAARALTGWTLRWPAGEAVYDPQRHDAGPKRFLGETRCWEGDEVLERLAAHPATAARLTHKLFRFLAGEDPSPALHDRLRKGWRGTVLPVVEQILMSEEFRQAAHRRRAPKSPVEFLVSALRALGRRSPSWAWLPDLRSAGQFPFLPPSVAGWSDRISTDALLARVRLAERLVAEVPTPGLEPLVQAAPEVAVEHLLQATAQPDAGPATRRALEACAALDAPRRLPAMLRLLLAGPEFQCR